MFYLFFFRQKTAYEMRISDWSSDVCSSDLAARLRSWCSSICDLYRRGSRYSLPRPPTPQASAGALVTTKSVVDEALGELPGWNLAGNGRASGRERVVHAV